MHVAIVSTYPPQACGLATYTHYLAAELQRSGCEVTIITEIQSRPPTGGRLAVRPCFEGERDYVGTILRAVGEVGPEVVHIQHEYGIFGFDKRFLDLVGGLSRGGIPTAVTLHTVHTALSIDLGCAHRAAHRPPPDFDVERYQQRICDLADRVIVHQERTTRQVLVRQGASPFKVTAIPHGTTVPALRGRSAVRRALNVGEREPLLVALGYFEPAKNILVLLEALPLLRARHPGLKLLMGGHIRHPVPETLAYMARCREHIRRHGLEDVVTILPDALSEREMTDFFSAADVACFAYDEDTRSASGALHRALGCGATVVAARIAKFDELSEVADELLVTPRSPGALADLLSRLLTDTNFRQDMANRLSVLVQRTLWPVIAWQHATLYAEMADEVVQPAAGRKAVLPAPV